VYRKLPDWLEGVVSDEGKPGWTLSLFSTNALESAEPTDSQYFPLATWMAIESMPDAIRLEGTYTPVASGKHYFSLPSLGHAKLFVNEHLVYDLGPNANPMAFVMGGDLEEKKQYDFTEGQKYRLRVEVIAPRPEQALMPMMAGRIAFHLGFMTQGDYEEDVVKMAVEAATEADVALVFVGNTAEWETEGKQTYFRSICCGEQLRLIRLAGQDATSMDLPAFGSQDRLIEAVAAVNPNTIVINCSGVPINMPWIESIPGLIQAWFCGQESGNAIIDVLFGTVNPSGKLPVSFPRRLEDTPSFGNFPGNMQTLTVKYEEGVNIGYRYYDRNPAKVLFPFGFGLSYTKLEIDLLATPEQTVSHGTKASVKAIIRNVGDKPGKEVVQVYIAPPKSRVDRPVKTLVGFIKVEVPPREAIPVSIDITSDSLAFWDEKIDRWAVERGQYQILIGNSSANVENAGSIFVPEAFDFGP
jgi:beta-glucosidase